MRPRQAATATSTVPRPHTGVCSGGCFSPQLPLAPTRAVSYLQALQNTSTLSPYGFDIAFQVRAAWHPDVHTKV